MMAFMPVNCWNRGIATLASASFQKRGLNSTARDFQNSTSCAFTSSTAAWMSAHSASTFSVPRMRTSTCACHNSTLSASTQFQMFPAKLKSATWW